MHIARVTRRLALITGAAALLTTAVTASAAPDSHARATLRDADGDRVGEVRLKEKRGEVEVRVEVDGLAPGFHGFHVHANSDPSNGSGCVAPAFTSTDGHYDGDGSGHGTHDGDLPVLLVNRDGDAEARFVTDRFRIADVLGRAFIIHANPDNYANIPSRYETHAGGTATTGPDAATLATGDAGARVACGVIAKK